MLGKKKGKRPKCPACGTTNQKKLKTGPGGMICKCGYRNHRTPGTILAKKTYFKNV